MCTIHITLDMTMNLYGATARNQVVDLLKFEIKLLGVYIVLINEMS